jgi:hypothetical protein
MTTDIFIRTYDNDLEWLKYCLKSIHKYVTGYRKIIICIPDNQKHLIDAWSLTQEEVHGVNKFAESGYIDQQINKIMAYKFGVADFVLFVDSDVCFKRPVHVSEYFKDGKPIILKTRYESVGDAICWKEPTEKMLGYSVGYEYMRRLPLLYRSETLKNLNNKIELWGFGNGVSKIEKMSEFNLVGAFAEKEESEKYHFIDTEKEPLPPESVKQNWSWGGLTEDIKKELEELTA